MWDVKKNSTSITMTEGDYGVEIPFEITGLPVSSGDTVEMQIKTEKNGEALITKDFTVDDQFTFELSFTEAESELLVPANYIYKLDWYSEGVFMCNIVNNGKLKVEDKI